MTVHQLEKEGTQPRRASLESAGVEFVDENGGGPGARAKIDRGQTKKEVIAVRPSLAKTSGTSFEASIEHRSGTR